jgi:hypothetical protein
MMRKKTKKCMKEDRELSDTKEKGKRNKDTKQKKGGKGIFVTLFLV